MSDRGFSYNRAVQLPMTSTGAREIDLSYNVGNNSLSLGWGKSAGVNRAVSIRLADSDGERSSAHVLLNRMYSWRGYGDSHVIPITPKHTTFTASDGERTIGTITLAVDSDVGLAADDLFSNEINCFRESGAKVCELTKLAFDASVPSAPLLAAMFHIVFVYGHRRHKCSDLFIEVNPRHRRFYEAMLGFTRIGEVKTNKTVGAPSQLMRLTVLDVRKHIDAAAVLSDGATVKSLYRHFFSPREESGIMDRLLGINSSSSAACCPR